MSNFSFTTKNNGDLYQMRLRSHFKLNMMSGILLGKMSFLLGEMGLLNPLGILQDTTEYLALGNALLAGLYLKVTVYITNLVSIIQKKSHALNETILFKFSHFGGYP